MNRRLLLTLAALALILGWAGIPGARAARLGGNYRGPNDKYIVRQDTGSTAPSGSSSGGGDNGSSAGGDAGAGDSGGSSGASDSSGGSSSGSSGGSSGGDAGGSGGSGGSGDSGGSGGSGGSGDSGGSGGSGDSGGSGSAPPDAGGTGSGGTDGGTGGAGDTGGGSTPAGGGSGTSTGPASSGGGGGVTGKGKGASQDDADKIWPFYFESAKEEYIAAYYARRPDQRLAPSHSSTGIVSPLPDGGRERRPIGETDRQEARDLVLGRLLDPDSHVRDAAVLALGKSGYKEAMPFLQRSLEADGDPAVREDSLLALGLSGQKDQALPVLLKALNTPMSEKAKEHRAAYAALGLGLLGDRDGAAEPLRKLYQAASARSDMMDEAACAATALGMLGDPAALPLFVKSLSPKAVPDPVRCYTIHAIGKYGTHPDEKVRKEALAILFAELKQKKDVIRQSAILALGSFSEPNVSQALVKEGLGSPDTYSKVFAAHSLGRIAGRLSASSREYALIAKELAQVSENTNKDRWLFQASNLALSSMAYTEQEKQLLGMLGDKKFDPNSSSAISLSLGLLGSESPAVTKELKALLESRTSGTYSGLALALTGSPTAADALGKVFGVDQHPNADVARTAAMALGLVGGAKDADILVEILSGARGGQSAESAKFFLKGAAVQGLGLIGDGDTVKKLKAMMTSTEWDQRAFATAALGYMLSPTQEARVSPRISEIFRHHNYHVIQGGAVPVVKAVQSTL